MKQISTARENVEAVISIAGNYGATEVSFELRIDGAGLITTKYKLGAFPFTPPAAHAHPWNDSHYGGFSEIGISFMLTNGIDRLAWNRKALWSFYPADHIGRSFGSAQRAATNGSWAQGSGGGRSFGGFSGPPGGAGTGTANDFRAMKEYIYAASALVGGTDVGLQAVSDAHDAVRMEVISVKAPE